MDNKHGIHIKRVVGMLMCLCMKPWWVYCVCMTSMWICNVNYVGVVNDREGFMAW